MNYRITLDTLGGISKGPVSRSCFWTKTREEARHLILKRRMINSWDVGELMYLPTLKTQRIFGNKHA